MLSYIVDFYFNTNDFGSAYKIAYEWHEAVPEDPLIYGLKVYTEVIYSRIPYEQAINTLVNNECEIILAINNDSEKEFIYRLAGEIALHYKQYSDAIKLLRKAYELDDNVFNLEDLGIATYFKAIEEADDGVKIKTSNINLKELNKAVEYFEAGFGRANGSMRRGVYSRVAVIYLRSIFYLRKSVVFDQMYDQLIEYCNDDIYEIQRMKAINDIQMNKLNMEMINTLNDSDKALILAEYYNIRGMYDHALSEISPVADKYFDTNEEIVLQLLATLFNHGDKYLFNEYFQRYISQ